MALSVFQVSRHIRQRAPFCPAARGSTEGPWSTLTTPPRRRNPSLTAPLLHACIQTHTVCFVTQQTCLLCHTADNSVA